MDSSLNVAMIPVFIQGQSTPTYCRVWLFSGACFENQGFQVFPNVYRFTGLWQTRCDEPIFLYFPGSMIKSWLIFRRDCLNYNLILLSLQHTVTLPRD